MKIVLATFLLLWSASASARALDSIDVIVYWTNSVHPDTIKKHLDSLHSRQLAISLPSRVRLIRMPDAHTATLNGQIFSYNGVSEAVGAIYGGTEAAGVSSHYRIEVPNIEPDMANDPNPSTLLDCSPSSPRDLFLDRSTMRTYPVKVAILDAGKLEASLPNMPNAVQISYYNTITHNTNVLDGTSNAHGHFVASIVARSLQPGDELFIYKVLDDSGHGRAFDAIKAIDKANLEGINVLNMSFINSGNNFSQGISPFEIAIRAAQQNEMLCIAAAGNNMADIDFARNWCEPAGLIQTTHNLISVLAADCNDGLATFSNWGQRQVTLGTYGTKIMGYGSNNELKAGDGTSYAAPLVTGVAIQLYSTLAPNRRSYSSVKNAIIRTVDVLPSLRELCVTEGVVNATAAYNQLNSSVLAIPGISLSSRQENENVLLSWSVPEKSEKYQFELEKSKNNVIFERVFATESNDQPFYEYVDAQPFAPATYYRLLTQQENGDRDTQKIVVYPTTTHSLRAFPNPVSLDNPLVIQFPIHANEKYQLYLVDAFGRKYPIAEEEWTGNDGIFEKRISIHGFAAGVYDAMVHIGYKTFRQRVIITP